MNRLPPQEGEGAAITIRFFAKLCEQIGQESLVLPIDDPISVAELMARLISRGQPWESAMADEQQIKYAVNQQMARKDTLLHAGDEVAFFPPVTGG